MLSRITVPHRYPCLNPQSLADGTLHDKGDDADASKIKDLEMGVSSLNHPGGIDLIINPQRKGKESEEWVREM